MQIRQKRRHFLANLSAAGVAAVFVSRDSLADGGRSDTGSITTGNFWTPEIDSELMAVGFFQEDLAEGTVNTWISRGRKSKTATGTATKLANNGGVLFAKGTQQKVSWAADNDAPLLHRWWVVIARFDPTGLTTQHIPVLTVNGAQGGAIHRQPYVKFVPGHGELWTLLDNSQIVAIQGAPYQPTFSDWNILVSYRRGGFLYAWINGVEKTPIAFTGMQVVTDRSPSSLGANNISAEGTMHADMAIDCALIGQGELSDAWIDKIVGWAHWRVGRQDLLPSGHPYKSAAPTPDGSEGTISRFIFNQADWDAWAAISKAEKTPNIGLAPPSLDDGQGDDYKRVFFTDFKVATDEPVDDLSLNFTHPWYAPTHLIGINADATALRPNQTPDCYILDTANEGTLTLRMQETSPGNGNWVSGAFSSVNKEGQGRTWGKGRWRARIKFPLMSPGVAFPDPPRPGFWLAFWTYGKEHLFWRTRNRTEHNFMEYNGLNGFYLNTTIHIHDPVIVYDNGEIRQSPDLDDEIFDGPLDSTNNFTPTIDIYDGQYHIWEFRIEDDFTYIIVDDKEAARVPTKPWLSLQKYIMIDWALRANENPAVSGETYDMTIDWVEVWQRERWLDDVPTGFSARPTLSGTRAIGNTITCTPNTTASQIQFHWFKDGEPIVAAESATFVETADSAAKALRVHVRALSLLNQPEAWTAEMPA
jgi:hypothetical protein